MAAAAGPQARASGFRSINQALAASPASAATTAAAGLTAARQAALGAQNLAKATHGLNLATSMQQALAKAAAAASQPSVPDGMVTGGLQVGIGVSNNGTINTSLWSGASLPAQPQGTNNVTVTQTAALAQLTWKTFNVGAKTHLTFDQGAGGSQANSWIVINRVADPLANPSQILGDISSRGTLTPAGTYAPGGKVYVLNANGIAFGAGSQVNVGSLIAATANIANTQFTTNADGSQNFSLYGAQVASAKGSLTGTYLPTFVPFTDAAGNVLTPQAVTVAQGAAITTPVPSGTSAAGYVMLLGGTVSNAGMIATPQGQTILSAGAQFTLREGFSGSTSTGNTLSTTVGSEIDASNSYTSVAAQGGALPPGTVQTVNTLGSVSNAAQGIIIADQGDVTLMGQVVVQDGGILSTTTVNARGTVHILTDLNVAQAGAKSGAALVDDKDASITFGPNSVTEIMPETSLQTALTTQREANIANSATLNAIRAGAPPASGTNPELGDTNFLPDQLGESRIEVSTGGSVDVRPGALAQAQGGQVAIGAGVRVLLEAGSAIDVSGTDTALLPASINDLTVSVQPYQLRDSAANRTGPLKSTSVHVDATTLLEIAGTGPYSGNIYTPGGLLEVSGYVGLVPHGITEWTAIGGQVTLQAGIISGDVPSGGQVITEAGSVINVQGGVVNYAAGEVAQSYVSATDGTIYNINDAPANLVYTGVYTGETEVHARWHVTDSFVNPLLTPSEIMQPAYSIGRDAGTVTVIGSTAVLQGSVDAGVNVGAIQTGSRPAGVTDAYLLAQTVVPQAGTLALDAFSNAGAGAAYATNVTIGSATGTAVAITAGGTLPAGLNRTAVLDAGLVSDADLADLSIATAGTITVAAPLTVSDGGTISLVAVAIKDLAPLTARGGGIVLSNNGRSSIGSFFAAPAARDTIVLGTATTLNASGIWTNALLQPGSAAGEGFANGGSVTIASVGALDLAPGSVIDVASGGALLAGGKLLSGAGGNISLTADLSGASTQTGAVTLDSTLLGYGMAGGGTLSIQVPNLRLGYATAAGGTGVQRAETVSISPASIAAGFLEAGFSSYVLDGFGTLSVAPGAQLAVAEPVYVLGGALGAGGGSNAPSGSDPSQVFSVILPPIYTQTKGDDAIAQRAGASIALLSSVQSGAIQGGGGVTIGAGASVSVDPGQSILVSGHGQITVLGTLTARGGSIGVENTDGVFNNVINVGTPSPFPYVPGLSIWIGSAARLDASGQAIVFTNTLGQTLADQQALAGGTITLGTPPAEADASTGTYTVAQVIVRPGAVVDASGTSVSVNTVPAANIATPAALGSGSPPVVLAGAGGTISADSAIGVALDGSIVAAGGGATAAGGVLDLSMDDVPPQGYILPAVLDRLHDVLVSNATTLTIGNAGLKPGQASPSASLDIARISQQQIATGGFGQVSIKAEDAVLFQGNATLTVPQSLSLDAGIIGDSQDTGHVTLNAQLVSFSASGADAQATSTRRGSGTLTVNAGLIEFSDNVSIGGVSTGYTASANGKLPAESTFGFTAGDFSSAGDIRFLGGTLQSSGNLTFEAAELLPASMASETVFAGLNDGLAQSSKTNPLASGTITVLGGAGPQNAVSVGGTLALVAGVIHQDGVLRAPEGEIRLGFDSFSDAISNQGSAYTASVVLGAGSVTSVSLFGQTIPFGGTVDGVNYVIGTGTSAITAPLFSPLVDVESEQVAVASGATLDLRGGGTLAGDGFIAGRGGSVDVLKTPLLDITGAQAVANAKGQVASVKPLNSGDQIYAILPSYVGDYAPAGYAKQDAGYAAPAAGERITVGSQVPGLEAGTYTLLPAYYALLPGAYRVELTSGTLPAGSLNALGNFTNVSPVAIGFAGTPIVSSLPVAALFTSSANVSQLAQYDTETYNSFEQNAGTTFGTPRPFLPQDAKTLLLNYPSQVGSGPALTFAPGALLQAPDPTTGGYGMTLEINTSNAIEVTAAGGAAIPGESTKGTKTLVFDAGVLSALDVPRLLLGGTFTVAGNTAELQGDAASVIVNSGALLTAGDVMLIVNASSGGSGTITVSSNATLSNFPLVTVGTATGVGTLAAAFDLSNGYYFDNSALGNQSAFPVLDVSGGDIVFKPTSNSAQSGIINVANNASLLAAGSLDFVAPLGTSVAIGSGIGTVTLGGKEVNLQISTLNLGSAPAFASYQQSYPNALPPGLNLTTAQLSSVLNGFVVDPNTNLAFNVPAARSLIITASLATNIIGDVVLNSGSTALVLNTPAIYGFGKDDTVTITTPSFTWSGVRYQDQASSAGEAAYVPVSSLPGGQIAGSATNVAGSLTIAAQTITLGYGPQTQPDDQTQLDRLVVGFTNVTLQATSEITANNVSSLSVYATQATYGQPGSGGSLTLASPLITTDAAAVLKVTAGGNISLMPAPGATPAATGTVTALGGEIDLAAQSIDIETAIALPSGRLTGMATGTMASANSVILGSTSAIDLSGRNVALFDQVAASPGGTLLLESTYGNITEAAGGSINVSGPAALVSSPGTSAGAIGLTALQGSVILDGSLTGTSVPGQTAGSFTLMAGNPTPSAPGTAAFDSLNTMLDAGGFTGARSFEIATGDITINQAITASTLSITADSGTITIAALLDASGTSPGSIAINAGGNLTLDASAVLDAHATVTAKDSYGQDIDAENAAHVTLTSTAGTLTIADGATIDLAYPDAATNPQGRLVLDAPRLPQSPAGVALQTMPAGSNTGSVNVTGALSATVYAFQTFTTTDAVGSISQTATTSPTGTGTTLGLDQIAAANTAWASQLTAAAVKAQLGGLTGLTETTGTVTASAFHLAPGVEIDAGSASGGTLTVIGDLDFSSLRTSDPAGFGLQTAAGVAGSGEAGAVVFRASGDLVVNGSISDGFAPPPDSQPGNQIGADHGWVFVSSAGADPLNSDLYLPASLAANVTANGTLKIKDQIILGGENQDSIGTGTVFDTSRAIALNYAINIAGANIYPNVVIPFGFTLGANTRATSAFTATAAITLAGQTAPTYLPGALVPANTLFRKGTQFAANSDLPFQVLTQNGTNVPAGTLLDIFADTSITLWNNTAALGAGAFLPSNTVPVFLKTNGAVIGDLTLRSDLPGTTAQGYIDAIAAMLPPGSASWNLNLVAGANAYSADRLAVLPQSQLNAGLATPAGALNAAPGSLILDDLHYVTLASLFNPDAAAAFSVIRTGTGELNLAAGGNFDQSSLYGIYTAGTQDYLPGGAVPSATDSANAPFDSARQDAPGKTTILEGSLTANRLISASPSDAGYQAYYPSGGGNVSLTVQGTATGDLVGGGLASISTSSDDVGNWLWTQGAPQLGIPSAWWINFGTFVTPYSNSGASTGGAAQLVGFQGIGTLGGGNLTVTIGGDAGQITQRGGANYANVNRGEGLVLAVASTGRLPTGSAPVITGGGTLSLRIGGTLNPIDANDTAASQQVAVNGDLLDLRGNISVSAGAIGRVQDLYTEQAYDPRADNPFAVANGIPFDGITLIPGDGSVSITTMRDLIIDGAADAGRAVEQNQVSVPQSVLGSDTSLGVDTGFTLWQADTTIRLFSSGGNVTPSTQVTDANVGGSAFINDGATDLRYIYPPSLLVTAATGNIVYGSITQGGNVSDLGSTGQPPIETMPAPDGQVEFLAGTSIFANGEAVDISGANPNLLSTAKNPSFVAMAFNEKTHSVPAIIATDVLTTDVFVASAGATLPQALFAQEPDTPTSDLHASDPAPALFYAAGGDIMNFITGQTLTFPSGSPESLPAWYLAAKPVWIFASQDIVSSGNRPLLTPPAGQQNQEPLASGPNILAFSSGDLFYNTSPSSISVVSAGRDILSGYFYVGGASSDGAGVLEVDAGRNLYQAAANVSGTQELDFGSIKSIGGLIEGQPVQGGANLAVLTGVGADPNYSVFASLYLDPANLANPALQLTDASNKNKVQQVYAGTDTVAGQSQLITVLQQRYQFSGSFAQAVTFYQSLTPAARQALQTAQPGGTAVISQLYAYLLTYASSLQTQAWNGTEDTALATFQALPAVEQDVFLRDIFFEETNASGLQYNDASSRFYHNYSRGQIAIDTFFLPLPELNSWLSKNFGYTGGQAGAATELASLSSTLQTPFISAIFTDDETPRSASDKSVVSSLTGTAGPIDPAFSSLLGLNDTKAQGQPAGYAGSMTMYSGPIIPVSSTGTAIQASSGGTAALFDAGIATSSYGGTIQAFDPGGQILLSIASSPAPGPNTGIITNGPGDIDIFADGSVLLGQSRIFTTDGGNILIWSAGGDINAGIGAKTTVVFNPPVIAYDAGGDVTETPAVPSSGAGIATLQPLAGIAAGNVDLVAPVGTIDAGEAGIRVSGNLNLAAARLANTANIAVGGKTAGITAAPSISVSAAAAASSAAGASTAATQNSAASHAQEQQPSVIEVAVLSVTGGNADDEKRRRKVK